MAPLAILGLAAQIIPSLVKYAGGGDKSVAIANNVASIATQLTGAATPDLAMEAIQKDPQKAMEFKIAVMAQEASYEQMYLADVQDARKRDSELRKAGHFNYRADLMVLGAAIFVGWLISIIWANPQIGEFAQGVFTLVLGRMLGYLDGIYNFEFGTTRETKESTKTANDLRAFARRKEIEEK